MSYYEDLDIERIEKLIPLLIDQLEFELGVRTIASFFPKKDFVWGEKENALGVMTRIANLKAKLRIIKGKNLNEIANEYELNEKDEELLQNFE